MKDENNGAFMIEFVELIAKIYVLHIEGKNTKKTMGIKNNVVRARSITFENYTRCLNDGDRNDCVQFGFYACAVVHKIQIARSVHDIRNKKSL